MNEFKKVVETYGNFKVSNVGSGMTRIHAHNDKFTLGVICTESKIRGSIKTKDGVDLYATKNENVSLEDVKTKLGELCMMYSRASAAFESVKGEDTKELDHTDLEKENDDKEVLLDDTVKNEDYIPGATEIEPGQEVVVGMSGLIVSSDEGEKDSSVDDIIVEDPITEIKTETVETAEDTGLKDSKEVKDETTVEDTEETEVKSEDSDTAEDDKSDEIKETETEEIKDEEPVEETEDTQEMSDTNVDIISGFDDASKKLVDIADTISALVSKFDDDTPDRKLVATGLSSTMYSVACDLKSFIDEFLTKAEVDKLKVEDETVTESVAVPAKTNYIDIARGGINHARLALDNNKSDKKINTILDVLSDIDSELVTQFN